jgi:hypothetical protein
MKAQFDNIAVSSLLLYIDHALLHKGQAFRNYGSRFFPIPTNIQGTYAYSAPFRGFVNDVSISGANVMSGVYLNNNYISVGTSGLEIINHYNGTVYFNSPLPSGTIVSGNYSIKEFNIKLVDKQDWQILFETEYSTQNRTPQTISGLLEGVETTPALFVRYRGHDNEPFAFAGIDNKKIYLRAILIADTVYQKIGATQILSNLYMTKVPTINGADLPFDSMGNWTTGVPYNWDLLPKDFSTPTWIWKAKGIDIPETSQYNNILRNMSMIDFDLSTVLSKDF